MKTKILAISAVVAIIASMSAYAGTSTTFSVSGYGSNNWSWVLNKAVASNNYITFSNACDVTVNQVNIKNNVNGAQTYQTASQLGLKYVFTPGRQPACKGKLQFSGSLTKMPYNQGQPLADGSEVYLMMNYNGNSKITLTSGTSKALDVTVSSK